MEKPTYTAIDYNSKENKVIEERIRNYYLPVKNVLETVRDRRIKKEGEPKLPPLTFEEPKIYP